VSRHTLSVLVQGRGLSLAIKGDQTATDGLKKWAAAPLASSHRKIQTTAGHEGRPGGHGRQGERGRSALYILAQGNLDCRQWEHQVATDDQKKGGATTAPCVSAWGLLGWLPAMKMEAEQTQIDEPPRAPRVSMRGLALVGLETARG
jgi:hypothetical protein